MAVHVQRLEFTLVLAALHTRLDFVTGLWPVVEAELNLDVTSNVLSRRPPQDYEPFTLESPMGNVLGFSARQTGGDSVMHLQPVPPNTATALGTLDLASVCAAYPPCE